MSPQPRHATGRPHHYGRGGEQYEAKFVTDRHSLKVALPTSPPRDRKHDVVGPHRYLQPAHPATATGVRKWEDEKSLSLDVNALEHALAAMRQDEKFFASIDYQYEKKRRDSLLMESASVKKTSPPKKRSADSRDAKPQLQSLAATHPSLYSKTPSNSMLPPPLPAKCFDVKTTSLQQSSEPSIPPWQRYSDPKHLTSERPMCADPRFRMLKTDVDSEKPSTVSPLFMIALPLGTLIEGAQWYPEGIDRE